jgi:hypothetical protein
MNARIKLSSVEVGLKAMALLVAYGSYRTALL